MMAWPGIVAVTVRREWSGEREGRQAMSEDC